MVKAGVEEVRREAPCGGKPERQGAHGSTRGFRGGESGFMRQRRLSVENGVGVRQQ